MSAPRIFACWKHGLYFSSRVWQGLVSCAHTLQSQDYPALAHPALAFASQPDSTSVTNPMLTAYVSVATAQQPSVSARSSGQARLSRASCQRASQANVHSLATHPGCKRREATHHPHPLWTRNAPLGYFHTVHSKS